jgi:hypothetical protein
VRRSISSNARFCRSSNIFSISSLPAAGASWLVRNRIVCSIACTRGIYDNMKTAVETIFVGKDRQYNRRFLQMCAHHLVEPVACTPASGWESLVRERFFTPRLKFKTYHELDFPWTRRD